MNDHAASAATPLSTLPPGSRGVVESVAPQGGLPARLAMLGIRRGVAVDLVQGPDARGAVLRVGGARIALGREVLDHLRLRPTATADGAAR